MSANVSVSTNAGEIAAKLRGAERNMERAMQFAGKDIARNLKLDFQRTTREWDNRSEFNITTTISGTTVTVEGGTDSKIWHWLDSGTSVRHAIMSPDWKSHTTPNVLLSGPGQGHVVFISKKINMPGIKARGWTKMLTEKWQKEAPATVRQYLERWAANPYGTPRE